MRNGGETGVRRRRWLAGTAALSLMTSLAAGAGAAGPVAAGGQGTLKGTITSSYSPGEPSGILVRAIDRADGSVHEVEAERSFGNPGRADFELTLAAGSYRLLLLPTAAQNYRATSLESVTITEGAETPVGITLGRGSQIAGRVVDEAGKPVAGVLVTAVDTWGVADPDALRPPVPTAWTTATRADGTYALRNLDPAVIALKFQPDPALGQKYLTRWYWDSADFDGATRIDLRGGYTSKAYGAGEIVMRNSPAQPGSITAIVTNESSAKLKGVEVRVADEAGMVVATSQTNANGVATITGIPAGYYDVVFIAPEFGLSSNYVTSTEGLVRVTAGNATSIAKTLVAGGLLHGWVKAGGLPLEGVKVEVWAQGNFAPVVVATTTTSGDGWFRVPALRTDTTYAVRYLSPSRSPYYVTAWYGGASSFNDALTVTVPKGSIRYLDDTTLVTGTPPTGTLTGYVQDSSSSGLEGVAVAAYSTDWTRLKYVFTNADGRFTLTGLPEDPVYLYYESNFNDVYAWRPEWYPNTRDQTKAQTITVVADKTTWVNTAKLDPGVGLRGDVLDDNDNPVGGVVVIEWADGLTTLTMPLNKGNYAKGVPMFRYGGLPPGAYRVRVVPDSPYYSAWYRDNDPLGLAPTRGQATLISLDPDETQVKNIQVTAVKAPVDPEFSTAKAGADRIVRLAWNQTVGSATYELQRRPGSGSTWRTLTTQTGVTYTEQRPAAPKVIDLCYRVRGVGANSVKGPWSPTECVYRRR